MSKFYPNVRPNSCFKQILRSLICNQEARSFQFNDFFLNIYAYNDSYSSCYSKVKTKGCLIENVNFRLHRTIDSKSSSEGGPARLKIDDGAKRNESRSWRSNLSLALYQITLTLYWAAGCPCKFWTKWIFLIQNVFSIQKCPLIRNDFLIPNEFLIQTFEIGFLIKNGFGS